MGIITNAIFELGEIRTNNKVSTDIISELVAAAGVTVDGLLIKDSGIPQAAITAHEAALTILAAQVSGVLADGNIPSLAAAKITSGTFGSSLIPNLAASKITSGEFADARISQSSVEQYLAGAKRVSVHRNSTALSTVTSTDTPIPFTTELYDDGGFHSIVSNTERLTVPTGEAGFYFIRGRVGWSESAGGADATRRTAWLRLNGVTNLDRESRLGHHSASSVQIGINVGRLYKLVATNYVELIAFQSSGSNKDVLGDNFETHFAMVKLGL